MEPVDTDSGEVVLSVPGQPGEERLTRINNGRPPRMVFLRWLAGVGAAARDSAQLLGFSISLSSSATP